MLENDTGPEENSSPPGYLRCAVEDVGPDNKSFENDDQAIEAEHQSEPPLIVSTKKLQREPVR